MSTATDRLLFLRKFLKHGRRVASVTPSSAALADAMAARVDPDRPQTIVELGAGTGPVSAIVAARKHPDSRFLAVELEPDFAARLAVRCPEAEVLCADVADLSEQLRQRGVERVDVMLSGLPVPSLPRAVNRAVVEAFERFGDDQAVFSQLTVMPWVYRPLYQRLFERVDFELVMKNVPPGGAYHCRRLKPARRRVIPGKP